MTSGSAEIESLHDIPHSEPKGARRRCRGPDTGEEDGGERERWWEREERGVGDFRVVDNPSCLYIPLQRRWHQIDTNIPQ